METPIKEGEYSRIRGHHFQGEIQHTGNSLKITITEFAKGAIYSVQVTNQKLQKDFRRALIFQKVDDLFNELVVNNHLQISDEQSLLLPIEVTYRGRNFALRVEIPLDQMKEENQAKKMGSVFDQMRRMSEFYAEMANERNKWLKQSHILKEKAAALEREMASVGSKKTTQGKDQKSKLIVFKGDSANTSFKYYGIAGVNTVKYSPDAHGTYTVYNHAQTIPMTGVYHFKVKVLTMTSHIHVGICGKNIRNLTNDAVLKSPYFMAYNLKGGYTAKAKTIETSPITISPQNIITVEINMNLKHLTWYLNDQPIYLAKIPIELEDVHIHPCIVMYYQHDSVQFLQP